MLDRFFADATTRVCIEFQEASAQSYACARWWIDGRDKYGEIHISG